jgi:hypothetical protein
MDEKQVIKDLRKRLRRTEHELGRLQSFTKKSLDNMTSTTVPIGSIVYWEGKENKLPDGWIKCNIEGTPFPYIVKIGEDSGRTS